MPWIKLNPEDRERIPDFAIIEELFSQPSHKIMPFGEALQVANDHGLFCCGVVYELPEVAVDDVVIVETAAHHDQKIDGDF